MACTNPCGSLPVNSAAAELLPSQIDNFTKQFFGTVVKTEVDGVVSWSLPCNLDVGLVGNPRGVDEGLACYFLRLFQDGITGLKGDKGNTGAAGINGNNAFTVTLASFAQPSLGSPVVQVVTQFNPAILEDSYVFIDTSGWYHVDGTDGTGVLFLTLVKEAAGAPATIIAGKLVVPSGFPGVSVTGPEGPTGPQGPTGSAGVSTTSTNGQFFTNSGTDFTVPLLYTLVDLTSSNAEVLLPVAGKYLITYVVQFSGVGAVAPTDSIFLKLRNVSTSADILGSEAIWNQVGLNAIKTTSLTAIVTTSAANNTVSLYAHGTTADVFKLDADHLVISYVRLQ